MERLRRRCFTCGIEILFRPLLIEALLDLVGIYNVFRLISQMAWLSAILITQNDYRRGMLAPSLNATGFDFARDLNKDDLLYEVKKF